MSLIDLEPVERTRARIKVIGLGGGGSNAVNTMIHAGVDDVDFLIANTDAQALEVGLAATTMQLGACVTRGLGAGGVPDIGRRAALEDVDRLGALFEATDMVFVTAGMGGGTGTGAAAVVAEVARRAGALTVGVVTLPFRFEGGRRMRQALAGLGELARVVDALLTIPNDKLLLLAGEDMSLLEAFHRADEVLLDAVRGICDLVQTHGFVNVDFADVRAILANGGRALMGTGRGSGKRRAIEAAQQAISCPLLDEVDLAVATGLLINLRGGPGMTLAEVNAATTLVHDAVHPDANIIFGSSISPALGEELHVTVIATGFGGAQACAGHASPSAIPAVAASISQSRETPAARTVAGEDDLDVPAFLRRRSRRP